MESLLAETLNWILFARDFCLDSEQSEEHDGDGYGRIMEAKVSHRGAQIKSPRKCSRVGLRGAREKVKSMRRFLNKLFYGSHEGEQSEKFPLNQQENCDFT
jgi:hypothetical protein